MRSPRIRRARHTFAVAVDVGVQVSALVLEALAHLRPVAVLDQPQLAGGAGARVVEAPGDARGASAEAAAVRLAVRDHGAPAPCVVFVVRCFLTLTIF